MFRPFTLVTLTSSLLDSCISDFAMREPPNADCVDASSEWPSNLTNLRESVIFGHYVANLVHCGPPSKAIVQMIEYLYSIGGSILFEELQHLLP